MQDRAFPQILADHATTFSFEFFPPKTPEAEERFRQRAEELRELRPTFVTCTYGAGGSTRTRTVEIVRWLGNHLDVPTAAHLCCSGHTRSEMIEILDRFRDAGIRNIVALRGDAPAGAAPVADPGERLPHACDLVRLIRDRHGDHFGIAVAGYPEGHPETPSKLADLEYLRQKIDAGANLVLTQLFFDNRDFYDFVERCELAGIDVPIVAGIMPIVSRASILRMCDLCGARVPAKLLRRLQKAGDDNDHIARVGIDWATQQCHDLLENHVRGIHFYVLNRSGATMEIYRRLGAADSAQLEQLAEE